MKEVSQIRIRAGTRFFIERVAMGGYGDHGQVVAVGLVTRTLSHDNVFGWRWKIRRSCKQACGTRSHMKEEE